MIKKIILAVVALLLIGGGTFFVINSTDNYDATKYSASNSGILKKGAKIDFTLPDQFDKAHSLEDSTRTIVFTFAKATSHVFRDFLKEQGDDFLANKNAFYIADISPMPVVIRNAFAMPDLKQSNYPVLLMYKDDIASKFRVVEKKDSIMIITLENKTVIDIKYVNKKEELQKTFL
jgi:hypothetical protein